MDSSNKTLNFREKIPAKKVFPNLTFSLTNRAYCSYNERKGGIFMQKLSKAAIGRSYTIQWMFGVPEVMDFLREHHVEEGDNIQIIRKQQLPKLEDMMYFVIFLRKMHIKGFVMKERKP